MSRSQEDVLPNLFVRNAAGCLASIEQEIHRHLNFTLGHHDHHVDPYYLYRALAIAVRDRLIAHWKKTHDKMTVTAAGSVSITCRWNFWSDGR